MRQNKRHALKKCGFMATACCLAVLQLFAAVPAQALGTPDVSSSVMAKLINETTTPLAPGIQEKRLTYTDNLYNFRTECFCVDVNLKDSNASIYAGTPDDGSTYKLQTVREQADAAIKNGKNVVAAVNGDYYNMATGEPQGVVMKNGAVIHGNVCAEPFFGIKKDGSAVIGDADVYAQEKDDIKEAIGGPKILVKDGSPILYNDSLYPCEAVGIRANGSAFFLCIDGAQYPYSEGITLADLAKLLADMGARQALMLDGGGSATCVTRTPGEKDLSCKNSPSDGWERAVGNSILIVSNCKSDGKFASAYVTPQDKTYTPKSSVQMEAAGLDFSGAPAELPGSGLTWSLSDNSFGTIDENGLLTSNGKTGQVQVLLHFQGKVVGKTTIEFAVPDDLNFASSSLSVNVNAAKSLDLITRYQGRDVVLDQSALKWDVPNGLGTVDENSVFHSGNKSMSGTVAVSLPGTDLTAKINLTVGQPPTVLCDFEDPSAYSTSWSCRAGKRNETCSYGFSTYPDEPVRFGNHALKLNFDFTTGQPKSTLTARVGPSESLEIPGTPTAIGMWVYATPEAHGEWLWTGIYDKNENSAVPSGKDYLVSQQTGIDWTGWKYLEAPIKPDVSFPLHIYRQDALCVLCVGSGIPGKCPMTKGSVYVDNIRAVYGSSSDDTASPIVDSVSVDGKTFTNSHVDITSYIHDDTGGNASGINWDRSKIVVDGKDYSADTAHFFYDKSGSLNLRGISWPDGAHKVTVDIQDNFGNETKKDVYFTVKSGSGTKVELTAASDRATLGGTYLINLSANHASDIKSIRANVNFSKGFSVAGVRFDDSVKSNSSYTYDADKGVLSLSVGTPSNPASDKCNLAAISVNIPKDTLPGSKLEYGVDSSAVEYNSVKGDGYASSFSCLPTDVPIVSTFNIQRVNSIVGKTGKILVADQTGLPVSGVDVAMIKSDGSSADLGKTGADGTLENSEMTASLQKITLQAAKENQYSFPTVMQSYNPQKGVKPSNLLCGTTSDPKTEKTITWMTSPLTGGADAVMEYAPASAYKTNGESAFRKISGKSTVLYYDTDSAAVRENSATATGLLPDTQYSCRVGDGTNWSDVETFKTMADTDKFSFDVFGDTQSDAAGGLDDFSAVLSRIEAAPEQPAFTIHTGDFVDDEQIFRQIDTTAAMLQKHAKFNALDMVHILGNHEYMGDDGTKADAIYGIPQNGPNVNKNGCYSTNYGNMHISVIGWTDSAAMLKQELEWLREDVRAANKTWNIVVTHQPAYNKNPDDPSTLFNEMLPPVCDELGIDFAFNGHDHTYGRTYSLIGGKQAANGTVYIATGHTAEKTYDIGPIDPNIFAYVQSDNSDKVYTTVTVNGKTLTVQAYKADGTQIDSYTATAKPHADKTKLQTAIANAEVLNESNYTAPTWAAFENVLSLAKNINRNIMAAQQQVDNALMNLQTAVAGLKAVPTAADRQTLQSKIQTVLTVYSDKSKYTGDSWLNLQKYLSAAESIIQNSAASQTDVENALSDLETAVGSLIAAAPNPPFDNGGSSGGRSGGNGGNGGSGGGSGYHVSYPAEPSVPVSGSPTAASVTAVIDAAPTVSGNNAAFGATVSSDTVSAAEAVATEQNHAKVTVSLPDSTIINQLNNSVVQTVSMTLKVQADIACGTAKNVDITMDLDSSVLQTAKQTGKDITVTIMNTATGKAAYSWTFKGADLSKSAAAAKNINLVLNTKTTVADTDVSKTVPSSVKGMLLTFANNGELPASADVHIDVAGQNYSAGQTLYLYYYNEDMKQLETVDNPICKVNSNGYVDISINHCSKYVLLPQQVPAAAPVKIDTGKLLSIKRGKTYQFMITASKKPVFVCGNSSVFRVNASGVKGNHYYFTVVAVGKRNSCTGFYLDKEKLPRTVGKIV